MRKADKRIKKVECVSRMLNEKENSKIKGKRKGGRWRWKTERERQREGKNFNDNNSTGEEKTTTHGQQTYHQ